ncbi:MAG: tRNA (N6-threonylcarbamoyladenosine(37)-N6)-methyltransferase TrmO [Deltaproteobacteria bacterium]|nr:tRNA (N6-threonylcarbamoyladenosine(37)-N6)-methyltransferase TrmO [Deltaproteobacteria bacterium]
MDKIIYRPIGVIHSEHKDTAKTPIQPRYAGGARGVVEVFPEFAEGLCDIEGFSHIYLLYHFHLSQGFKLISKPFLQDMEHGVFAIRSPHRPNGLGLSVVELLSRRENLLDIAGVDVIDGTPLLDIKPYTTKFDGWIKSASNGWQDDVSEEEAEVLGSRGNG